MRRARKVFILLASVWPGTLPAQSVGTVTGIVSDPAGAAVPGAAVLLSNLQTGLRSAAETNEAGVYTFANVYIGTYELRVERSGFRTFVRSGFTVETGQVVRLDLQLELGSTQESITVTGEPPLLDLERASGGTQVVRQQLNSLPFQLTGAMRNPFAFLRLTPGAVGTHNSTGDTRIAGGRGLASEAFVDGVQVTYNAAQSVAAVAHPPYDTIAEFRVEAVIPPAEFGRTSGGVVLMSTRAGTSQFHGNLTLLLRNHIFDARRYNAERPDLTRQGEFAGSLGGPVLLPGADRGKSKTFFFANYTGFRRISLVQGASATLATPEMRQGDFAGTPQIIYDPQTADGSGRRQPFPGNRIPANRISPIARRVSEAVVLPNRPGIANNYLGENRTGEDSDSYFLRLDHQISEHHRLSGSTLWNNRVRLATNGPLPIFDEIIDTPDTRNAALGYDWIVRPNLFHRLQFGLTYFRNDRRETIGDLGIQIPGAFRAGMPAITFTGQGMKQIGFDNSRRPTNYNWNLQQSLTWTTGRHNVKIGGRFDRYFNNFNPFGNMVGTYNFSQFATSQPQIANTGYSYASFLLGLVNSGTTALALAQKDMSRYFAVFAQDDWKLLPRLTLNYGIRYEMQEPWFEPLGRVSQMDPGVPNPGAGNLPGALVFAGEGPGRIGGKRFMLADRNNLSPRFGFAWQAARKTVLRGGYGIYYAPLVNQDLSRQGFNTTVTLSSLDGGLTPAFILDQGFPPGSVRLPPFIDPAFANGTNAQAIERRRGGSGSMPMTQQWQFSLQQTVWDTLFDAAYAGTVGHGITTSNLVQLNQLPPQLLALGALLTRNITDPQVVAAGYRPPYPGFRGTLAQSLRAFPHYLNVNVVDAPVGNSTYHAFLLKVERRMKNGLQYLVSYAFSKTLTDVTFNDTELPIPQDTYNRRAEKSLANTDVPNRVVFSYTYELPFGRGKPLLSSPRWNWLAGGWSVAGIHTYQKSGPLRVTNPNNLPIFNGHLRPDRVPDVPVRIGPGFGSFRPLNVLSGEQGDLFLNPEAFATPPPFTFGNLGVFLPDVRGFGQRSEDISAMKQFRFRPEGVSMEFRADFFNAFNRRNLNNPVADRTNPNFGRITGSGAARIVQFGWRLEF